MKNQVHSGICHSSFENELQLLVRVQPLHDIHVRGTSDSVDLDEEIESPNRLSRISFIPVQHKSPLDLLNLETWKRLGQAHRHTQALIGIHPLNGDPELSALRRLCAADARLCTILRLIRKLNPRFCQDWRPAHACAGHEENDKRVGAASVTCMA
eukprot:CAMPEP_0194496614 /NCGR_PEP_ID=MMETSP0253-20130528/13828_1 /TAXON_ID=2966 /ORGANISM="Noctiluca scintillans" /LENGTH=154 /DNA_ID=CAMNT_0039338033 /DNA_START=511 /DNA_END=971 /DNA_ORIENTATION=+